jgi:hypothetical protein
MNPIEKLQSKIFAKKSGAEATELTSLLDFSREFGTLGDILGREFEVKDKEGKLVYTIEQLPMKIPQLNNLLKEFSVLKQIDFENQQKAFGTKGGIPKLKK